MTAIANARLFTLLTLLMCCALPAVSQDKQVQTIPFHDNYHAAVGKHILYFQETDDSILSLQQAKAQFASADLRQGSSQSISLGIGVDPVWMKFTVLNSDVAVMPYRLAIETPWLDYIDVYVEDSQGRVSHVPGGDGRAFARQPMPYRFYAFESEFASGLSTVYIRVETRGPMALPVRLSSLQQARSGDVEAGYQYGLLYGVMGALAINNLLLFSIIRQREYGLYSLYLCGFLLNSLSYTGHMHSMFPTDISPYFQDWLDAFLMITYSVAGLHFARTLLNTQQYAPNLDKFTLAVTLYIPSAMLLSAIADQLVLTLVFAFLLNSGFAILFIAMGFAALKHKVPAARLFVISSVTAALSIGISTMAVAGILPYTDFTYKLIEMGMAFEALFLAIILAQRFRMAQRDKILAEKYARTDILTGMRNRRGFKESFDAVWHTILRRRRNVSIVLLDIDNFKSINDTFGHDGGDVVLKHLADIIMKSARKGDISARWGGEEFVLFLPETDSREAAQQAERLRQAIAADTIAMGDALLTVTSSVGVAGTVKGQFCQKSLEEDSLDLLLKCADKALYNAKRQGKNRVCVFDSSTNPELTSSQLGLNI